MMTWTKADDMDLEERTTPDHYGDHTVIIRATIEEVTEILDELNTRGLVAHFDTCTGIRGTDGRYYHAEGGEVCGLHEDDAPEA